MHDVREAFLAEPVAPEVAELVDVARVGGSGIVRLERRRTVRAEHDAIEPQPVHGRQPEAGGEVRYVPDVEGVGEDLERSVVPDRGKPTTKTNGCSISQST